jgi:aryl-alcohol dehydrogenase-like predicted oxidoreductase
MSPLPLRSLGANGPQVPAMGLGLMTLSGSYGTKTNDEERFKFLDRAVELGETFWDSSELVLPPSRASREP